MVFGFNINDCAGVPVVFISRAVRLPRQHSNAGLHLCFYLLCSNYKEGGALHLVFN
jgi:hypothetical protein